MRSRGGRSGQRGCDAGASWTEIAAFRRAPGFDQWCVPLDPPRPVCARAVVIDRQNPDRWCVGVEVGGMMLTEDGGRSWTFTLPGGNPDLQGWACKDCPFRSRCWAWG